MPFATSWRSSGRPVKTAFVATATAAIAVGATVAGVLPSSVAYAANSKTTAAAAAQAQAKLDALGVQADKAVEAFNQAQMKVDAAAAQAKAQQAAVAKAKSQVATAKAGIQALAAAEYENGSASSAITYALSADPSALLQKADLLAQVNRVQTAGLTKIINADRSLEAAQTRANQALAAQKAASAALAARKAAVEKAVNAQQALANSLQAQLKNHHAPESPAARAAQVQQQAASRAVTRSSIVPRRSAPGGAPAPVAAPHVSGSAGAAVAYAYAQLGKPYRFGGSGPGSFDCSGLTMRAWQAAGVSLAHSSSAQQHEGARVSLSALQPGDLVFWGNPAYHVAIYIGGGRIIAAPHTGTVVQIQSIWGSPSMAVRP